MKKDLGDGGLRSILIQIETAPNRERALYAARNGTKYGPQFRKFLDEMLLDLGLCDWENEEITWKGIEKRVKNVEDIERALEKLKEEAEE